MGTTNEYIEYVAERLNRICDGISYKKMFGEYMVYMGDKPILLVCDNTVFVKMHPVLAPYFENAETGTPYEGAKEHYVLDIDDAELLEEIVYILEEITPSKKKK